MSDDHLLDKTPEDPKYRRHQEIRQWVTVVATAVSLLGTPLVVALIGNWYTSAIKNRELQARFLELAVQVLNQPDTAQSKELRAWAVRVIDRYSEVQFSAAARSELEGGAPITQSTPLIAELRPDSIDCDVPPDAFQRSGYLTEPTPPSGSVPIAWMMAVHDGRKPGVSRVEVDYLHVYVRRAGKTVLFASSEYNSSRYNVELWGRRPWFSPPHEVLPGTIVRGSLILPVSSRPTKIWTWWTDPPSGWPGLPLPHDADALWVEAKVKVRGPALVRAGIDYRQADVVGPPREAGASHWLCEDAGWQLITFGKP